MWGELFGPQFFVYDTCAWQGACPAVGAMASSYLPQLLCFPPLPAFHLVQM